MRMNPYSVPGFLRTMLLLLALGVFLGACGGKKSVTQASFVGKWRSSKLATPVLLYDNGEWEIRQEDGSVLQYGIWEYRDKRIIWTVKLDGKLRQDPNPVVSVSADEFQLQEHGTITVFTRIK